MEKVKILVNSPELHVIHAGLDMIVKDFRQLVDEECGIVVDRQILIYKAQIMVDHRTLRSYDLEDGKCLQFVDAANLNDVSRRLDLMYTRLDISGHEKLVNSSDNVNLLYMANCQTRDICERNIALLTSEVNCRKTRKFPPSSSSSGSGTEKNTVEGTVNIKGSKSLSIRLDLNANVRVLKKLIEGEVNDRSIPSWRQILVYRGSIMADNRILKSYGLEGEDAATDSIHLLEFADAAAVNDNLQRVDLYSHELGDSEIKSTTSESLLNLNKLYTERLGICITNVRVLNEIVAHWPTLTPKPTGTSHPVQQMVDQQNVDSNFSLRPSQYQYGGTSAGAGAGAGGDLLQRSSFNLVQEIFPASGDLGQHLFNIAQEKCAAKLTQLYEMGSTDTYQNTTSLLFGCVRNLEAAARRLQNDRGTSGDLGQRFFSLVQERNVAELTKLQQMGFCDARENTVALMFAIVKILEVAVRGLPSH